MFNINLKNVMKNYRQMETARENVAHIKEHADLTWYAGKLPEAEAALETACKAFVESAEKLTAAIAVIEKQTRVRSIAAEDICKALVNIENKLDIPKKSMEGIYADVDIHAQRFPTAYHGRPESTQFTAVYKSGSWRIINITRGTVKSPTRMVEILHTDESRRAIIDRLTHF